MTTAIPVDAEIPVVNPRIRRMLTDPILPMLVRLAWPNVLIMLAQASTGLIETWWVAHLGTDALAGMALVFPAVMLMQMMAAGAFGGGISSAISRALGGGRNLDADQLATHAVVINVVLDCSSLRSCCSLVVRSIRPSAARVPSLKPLSFTPMSSLAA